MNFERGGGGFRQNLLRRIRYRERWWTILKLPRLLKIYWKIMAFHMHKYRESKINLGQIDQSTRTRKELETAHVKPLRADLGFHRFAERRKLFACFSLCAIWLGNRSWSSGRKPLLPMSNQKPLKRQRTPLLWDRFSGKGFQLDLIKKPRKMCLASNKGRFPFDIFSALRCSVRDNPPFTRECF